VPKKKNQETQAEQSERFKKAVRDLIDAGDLNPAGASALVDRMIRQQSARTPKAIDD